MSSNITPWNAFQEFPNRQEFLIGLSLSLIVLEQQPTEGLSMNWGFEWSLLAGVVVKPVVIV